MTNTADDVRKVVEYAKYSPIGKRGISTMRAHTLYAPPSLAEYMLEANERVKVYAQIETELGVKNILVEQDNANKFEDGDIAQMARSFAHLRPIIPMDI